MFLSNLMIDSRPCDNDFGPIALPMIVADGGPVASVERGIQPVLGRSK